jgi:hypothetical protein
VAISQQLYNAINQARIDFVETVGEHYWDTPANREVLITFLRKEGIPPEEWISKHIFSAAFVACESQGLLEKRPIEAPESEIQRWERIERENRRDGREGNKRNYSQVADETPAQLAKRLLKEQAEAQSRSVGQIKAAAEAQAAKERAENDMTCIPTPEQIGAGVEFSGEQLRKLSPAQVSQYLRNVSSWRQTELTRLHNEKQARVRQ